MFKAIGSVAGAAFGGVGGAVVGGMIGGAVDDWLRSDSSGIDEALNIIETQKGLMDDDVLNPFRDMAELVTGGAWIGNGADAFVQEVQSELIPEILSIISGVGGYSGSIVQSRDIIHAKDAELCGSQVEGIIREAFQEPLRILG